jgi:hypothetical protein
MALGVDSASNRNEYQESSGGGVKGRRYIRLTTSPCGSLDVSQPYGPPQPVTGIALPFFLRDITTVTQQGTAFEHANEGHGEKNFLQ